MTRRGIVAVLVGGIALAFAGCRALLGTQVRLRYRITITCDTPDGIKSGTAVQEIYRDDPIDAIKPINLGTTEMTGDAVVLTVGDTHYFVDLILCSSLLDDAIRIGTVSPVEAKGQGNGAEMLKAFKRAKGVARMDGAHYMSLPSRHFGLARFTDERNFSTINFIDFVSSRPEWALISVVVSITDDPVSRQAIKLLPWLLTVTKEEVKKARKGNDDLPLQLAPLSDKFGEK